MAWAAMGGNYGVGGREDNIPRSWLAYRSLASPTHTHQTPHSACIHRPEFRRRTRSGTYAYCFAFELDRFATAEK
jgi:hypothetical protein